MISNCTPLHVELVSIGGGVVQIGKVVSSVGKVGTVGVGKSLSHVEASPDTQPSPTAKIKPISH